jgi:Caspase domain
MAKLALLIGVSEYEPGLNPLPAAVKDLDAMQEVLIHPDIGGFAASDVTLLKNPDRQVMEEAIYSLFAGRQRDDLLLLFFSGHGIKDDNGTLYLATRGTRKAAQGDLIIPTAVSANFVHDRMDCSRSKRQIVILDSCFSGAFAEGMSAKNDGTVDIRNQLGGEGRAVLTSSSSTQYSFEQEGEELSLYSRFLIEGIKTGEADLDGDEVVSIDELHEYASRKVREVKPELNPEIYAIREGFKIRLTKVPPGDPLKKYRKEVARFINRGEISFVGRKTLDVFSTRLGLNAAIAEAIEDEVLEPYRNDFRKKLQQYEQVFRALSEREEPIHERDHVDLQNLQQILGLRNEDTVPIEARVVAALKAHRQNLQVYEQALGEALRQASPLDKTQQRKFQRMQQQMELTDAEIDAITVRVIAEVETRQQHAEQYEQQFARAVQQQYPLSDTQRLQLQYYRESLSLSEVDVAPIEAKITTEIKTYQQKAQNYRKAFLQATLSKHPPNEVIRLQLQQTWQTLGLIEADVQSIEAPILAHIEKHQANIRQYEQEFTEATQQQYPFPEEKRLSLQQCQQQLDLSDEDVTPIQTRITADLEEYLQKLEQYEKVLSASIQFEYPFNGPTRQEIKRFQQVLELSNKDAAHIEEQILVDQGIKPLVVKPMAEPVFESIFAGLFPQSELTEEYNFSELPPEEVLPPEPLPLAVPKGQPGQTKIQPEPLIAAPKQQIRDAMMRPLLERVPKRSKYPSVPTMLFTGAGIAIFAMVGTAFWIRNRPANLSGLTMSSNAQVTLDTAQQQAKEGKLKQAITTAAKVPENDPAIEEAKKLVDQSSGILLQQATKQYEAGKFNEAITTAKSIPTDSSAGKKAQQLIPQWKKKWVSNVARRKAAQQARQQREWQKENPPERETTAPIYTRPNKTPKVSKRTLPSPKERENPPKPSDPCSNPQLSLDEADRLGCS